VRTLDHGLTRAKLRSHGSNYIRILSPELRTALPNKLTFADPEKIRELATQGDAVGKPESEQMLEHGIQAGKGGVYFKFTRGQFHDLAESLSMPLDDLHILVGPTL
jgi:hypothetical protein